jgi:bifunctional ADP-heptose synthase (sugar kinase/adenylyltransferase)
VDTRSKILTAEDAPRIAGPLTLVTGYFDVLRREDVRELEASASLDPDTPRLLVAVLPLENALLAQRARAELVAGLRMVDYVIAASESEAEELIRAVQPRRVVRLEAAHARLAQELSERVHRRRGNPAPSR